MRKILTSLLFAAVAILPLHAEDVAPPQQSSIDSYDDWKSEMKDREKVEAGSFSAVFARMIVLLLITVVGLVVFAWAAKRFLASRQLIANRTGRIQILEHRPLSPKAALILIQVDDQQLLVAESHAGLHFLKEIQKNT